MPDGLDTQLYVPRESLERSLRDAVADGRNVVVLGERRAGKTTLVRKALADVSEVAALVTVDGSLASTPEELLRLVARALGAPLVPRDAEATGDVVRLLDMIEALPHKPDTVIVLEGPLHAEVAYTVFGRLRDPLWRLPSTWVTTATPDSVGPLRTPPADAFWSRVLDVPPMDSHQIDELLERALDLDDREILASQADRPVRATPGHVVRWAQEVLDDVALDEREIDLELEQRAAVLGRQASMVLAELRSLGRPVSAGDTELLGRLGWTRANAARWLARMEREGIVRAFVGFAQGQGRPPKLYEPARHA
jgi:hypothetical protein